MKTIYHCDICGTYSADRRVVEACEARGRPDLALGPPRGLLVGDVHGPGPDCGAPGRAPHKGRCDHLCGAGFIWVVERVDACPHDRHEYRTGFGVFRGNGCGDTYTFTGKSTGGYDTFKFGHQKHYPSKGFERWQEWPEAQPCAAFWRAVVALRDAGWTPTVLRGGQAVPFTDPVPPHSDASVHKTHPIGAEVRLKRPDNPRTNQTAKIVGHVYTDEGGLKLDRPLDGFKYWNIDDVDIVTRSDHMVPNNGG